MKRILVLALALILVVGSLTVPAYAEEIEVDDQWINVLDYAAIDGDGDNYIIAGTSQSISYKLPFVISASNVDMVIRSAVAPTSVTYYGTSLTIVSLGDYLYRIYGTRSAVGYTNTVKLDFKFSEGTGLNVLALKVASAPISQYPVDASFYLSSPFGSLVLDYAGSGVSGSVDFTQGANEFNSFLSTLTIPYSEWCKYDFIDVILYYTADSIDSFSCFLNSTKDYVLNPSYSFAANTDENSLISYIVTASIDLRTIDRTAWKNIDLIFEVTGSFSAVSGGYASLTHTFSVNSVVGSLALNTLDPEVFWLRRLYNGLSSWFDDLESSLLESNSALADLISSLHSGVEGYFSSLEALLQSQHEAELEVQNSILSGLTTGFSNLQTWLSDGFTSVNTNLSTLISRVNVFITNVGDWINTVVSRINVFNTNVGNWFTSLKSHLTSLFDSLFDILNSSGDNEGFNDDVADQDDRLDEMEGVMDSVTQPDLDSIDTDLTGIVSTSDLDNVASIYTMVIGDGFVGQIMTMVVVMAMMSFVLFGKR